MRACVRRAHVRGGWAHTPSTGALIEAHFDKMKLNCAGEQNSRKSLGSNEKNHFPTGECVTRGRNKPDDFKLEDVLRV